MSHFGLNEPVKVTNSSHKKSNQIRDYRKYYNSKTIQIEADWYAKDIEMFGFDFDSAAQKNTHFSKD
ncbi:MAG: hypothetical protein GY742_17395 [Hyphomicrobiales bacterium]|nr:hypothetical protein [Hyphomicrobiales bacterium]